MDKSKIVKKYSNREITVVWEPSKCVHVGNCVRGLPEVFDAKAKPWVNIEGADTKSIINQVKDCPSGALSILENVNPEAPKSSNTHVELMKNGPLMIDGAIKLTQADGSVILKNKKTAFCRCGASSRKPYCDGSHTSAGFIG
ncbi:MAG: (4Fe-4S)-binding protein [Saprospiraceae bacterium]